MSARLTASFTIDPASHSVVICCADCTWRDLTATRQAAWTSAAAHARTAHPAQVTAALSNVRKQTYRKRNGSG